MYYHHITTLLNMLLSLSLPQQVNSLVSNIESRPHFICVVAGGLAGVEEPLQLGHAQVRGDALRVLSVRRPGAAPGPGEPGHERHFPWKTRGTCLRNITENNMSNMDERMGNTVLIYSLRQRNKCTCSFTGIDRDVDKKARACPRCSLFTCFLLLLRAATGRAAPRPC